MSLSFISCIFVVVRCFLLYRFFFFFFFFFDDLVGRLSPCLIVGDGFGVICCSIKC